MQLTKYSRFPEENVHNGDVLFIGVVVHIVLTTKMVRSEAWFKSRMTLAREDMSSLSPMEFGYFDLIGPNV